MSRSIRQEILDNLDGLQAYALRNGGPETIRMLAKRYRATPEIVEEIIAEWSAGRDKVNPAQDAPPSRPSGDTAKKNS